LQLKSSLSRFANEINETLYNNGTSENATKLDEKEMSFES
jgi:hypothetical protein